MDMNILVEVNKELTRGSYVNIWYTIWFFVK